MAEVSPEQAAGIREEYEQEAATRSLSPGAWGAIVAVLAAFLSLYAIYWVLAIVEAQT